MKGKIYAAREMAQLYAKLKHEWLLLQILVRDKHGRAQKVKLIDHNPDKEKLRDRLLDTDNWSLEDEFVFVFSDPDKICEI